MNILATLDKNYIHCLNVMLYSLRRTEPETELDVFVLHSGLEESDMEDSRRVLGEYGGVTLIRVSEEGLAGAPVTDRYPREIYYRIFAAKYLPDTLDRVLYLDPDLVVNRSLRELYEMPMGTAYFAAASHIGNLLHLFNELRLDMDEVSPYINSGVMLMNLRQLRAEQDTQAVFDYMRAHRGKLLLPDQDIISALYGDRIIPLDAVRYNMTERLFTFHRESGDRMDLDYVRNNTHIIHYCGRNKPWKSGYVGRLDAFYLEAESGLRAELPDA